MFHISLAHAGGNECRIGHTAPRVNGMRSTLLAALLTAATIGNGQVLIKPASASEPARILPSDLTILDAGEPRHDLECTVTPQKAQVGFDLRFHAGYDVSIPLRELSGTENLLSIVFRVTPEGHPDEALYFEQHVHVPAVQDDASGEATLQGSIDLGEGNYQVAWLMRDRS